MGPISRKTLEPGHDVDLIVLGVGHHRTSTTTPARWTTATTTPTATTSSPST